MTNSGALQTQPPQLAPLDVLTAALVARQSRTNDGSMSVADQIDTMRDYCERQGWQIGGIYEEPDVSGTRPLERRHGLKRAVADVESGRAQIVLTAYFDRFVRSVATRAEVVQRVEAKGGRVMTLDVGRTSDATAAEWLSGTLLAAIAEFYARQIGEKTVISKQRNIDRGIPPFPRITPAYERISSGPDKGRLRPHPRNAPIIREAIRLRLENDASYTTLARWLADRGIEMTPGGIQGMFQSKLLIGEIHFGHFRPNLNAINEPICSRADFRRLQKTSAPRGRYGKSERLLARLGILRCETCNARMIASKARGAGGKSYSYYRCGDRLCERPASVSCDVADNYLRDEAIRLSRQLIGRASADAEIEAARRGREIAELKLTNAIEAFLDLGGEDATKRVLDELQAKRDAAVAEHQRLVALSSPDLTVRTVDEWDDLPLGERRDLLRALVSRATVRPGRGAGRIRVEAA